MALRLDFLCVGIKDVVPASVAKKTWAEKVLNRSTRRLLVDRGKWLFRSVDDPRNSLPSPAFHAVTLAESKRTGQFRAMEVTLEPEVHVSEAMTYADLGCFFKLDQKAMVQFSKDDLSTVLQAVIVRFPAVVKGMRPAVTSSYSTHAKFVTAVTRVGKRWNMFALSNGEGSGASTSL